MPDRLSPTALIFDMDGVIVDSEALHEAVDRDVFEAHGLDVPLQAFATFKGRTSLDVFTDVVQSYGNGTPDPAALIEHKHRLMRSRRHLLQPIGGALPFIERLAAAGFPLGLTTSSGRSEQSYAFERFALAPYFAAVVTAEDVERPKPHPEPYLRTAEALGLDPAVCLVIEDSTAGVRAAQAAGCTVVGFTSSFSAAPLREAGAHLTVDAFDELSRRLAWP